MINSSCLPASTRNAYRLALAAEVAREQAATTKLDAAQNAGFEAMLAGRVSK